MTTVPVSRPLFVFGTLCDADLRELVLGDEATQPRPATLAGYRALRLPDEAYPVLSPQGGGRLHGLLLDLGSEALERVAFYEGEEYGFEPIIVEVTGGVVVDALVCVDRAARAGARIPWSLEDWQVHHKRAFMPIARRYMVLFGQMSVADADGVWRSMIAGG